MIKWIGHVFNDKNSFMSLSIFKTMKIDFYLAYINATKELMINRPLSLWVCRRDNPRGMLGEHEKSL